MASQDSSKACCTIPPVQAKGYENKGTFAEIAGLKTYKTGPTTAKKAIVLMYDVFGFGPQIQQGADLLAHASGDEHEYQVFIPDFLEGNVADPAWFAPPASKEKQMAMGKYFGPGGPGNIGDTLKKLDETVQAIKSGGIEKVAVVGYCWGAKIVSLAAVEGTAFTAVAEVHPSLMAVDDAPKVTVPICVLASQDEDGEVIKGFGEALTVPKHVETFPDAPHGWMSSRADLEDPKAKDNFERGYATVLKFFHDHM